MYLGPEVVVFSNLMLNKYCRQQIIDVGSYHHHQGHAVMRALRPCALLLHLFRGYVTLLGSVGRYLFSMRVMYNSQVSYKFPGPREPMDISFHFKKENSILKH